MGWVDHKLLSNAYMKFKPKEMGMLLQMYLRHLSNSRESKYITNITISEKVYRP